MRYIKIILVLFLSIVINSNQVYSTSINNEEDLVGTWLGKLKIQTMELRLVIRIEMKDGKLNALIDSPDQGAKDIPVSEIKVSGDSVFVISTIVGGRYEGLFLKDSLKLVGVWKQGGGSFPLEMKKVEKVEEPKRPQEPKPPFSYNTEEIIFDNARASIKLAGTLTYPKEGTEFPVAVMISGSGPQDRNETVFNHKPFWVIADHLTKNGIAVLRFDDRGIGKSTGNYSNATSEDFASDVVAAIEYLKTRKEINKKKIGLIGHSEGGTIAPMIAADHDEIAFIILVAGTGIPGDELLLLQSKLIMESEGEKPESVDKAINLSKKIYSLVTTETDTTIIHLKANEYFHDYFNTLTEEERKEIPDENKFIQMQLKSLESPWFKYFLKYDPRPALEKVKCPVLALNGEKDLQVPPKENLSAIEKALKKGGNINYQIVELPGLNHLFQTSTTGKISEYASIEETFSLKVLEIITEWIKNVIKK